MNDNAKILDLTFEACAILLENGAEISRVEETMRRIAGHFGIEDEGVFVLSNGIIAVMEINEKGRIGRWISKKKRG